MTSAPHRQVGLFVTLFFFSAACTTPSALGEPQPDVRIPSIVDVQVPLGTVVPAASPTADALPTTQLIPAQPTATLPPVSEVVIGHSVLGRPINLYQVGHGSNVVLAVGAIHGGYEWNTAETVEGLLEYYSSKPDEVPVGVSLWLLPVLNPDGMALALDETGRFNANGVDLNRNWDCAWQPESTWRTRTVSAGTEPFSEPEARALRDLVATIRPALVIFYHSQAGTTGVGSCAAPLAESVELAKRLAEVTGYRYQIEDFYPVSGDATGYFNQNGLVSVEVELWNHEAADLEETLAGMRMLLAWAADRP